jgi:hypothetical protein
MIYLEKGEENTFVLTLTENVSISNPTFLFKFTWEMSEDLSPRLLDRCGYKYLS